MHLAVRGAYPELRFFAYAFDTAEHRQQVAFTDGEPDIDRRHLDQSHQWIARRRHVVAGRIGRLSHTPVDFGIDFSVAEFDLRAHEFCLSFRKFRFCRMIQTDCIIFGRPCGRILFRQRVLALEIGLRILKLRLVLIDKSLCSGDIRHIFIILDLEQQVALPDHIAVIEIHFFDNAGNTRGNRNFPLGADMSDIFFRHLRKHLIHSEFRNNGRRNDTSLLRFFLTRHQDPAHHNGNRQQSKFTELHFLLSSLKSYH